MVTLLTPTSHQSSSDEMHNLFGSHVPLGYAGGDANLTRYVGNSPTTFVDPSGTTKIQFKGYVAQTASSIDPTALTNMAGGNWQWIWEPNDGPSIAQRVSIVGSFVVQDDCGFNHLVAWREKYVEVWTRGGTNRDAHRARPKPAAEYLEEKTRWLFRKSENDLFFEKGFEQRKVESWTFHMQAKFELVNGNYPNWNAQLGGFYTTKNDFQITNLSSDNSTIIDPTPTRTFNRMLYPGGTVIVVPGFPPPRTVGKTFVADDEWTMQWTDGELKPRITYTTTMYR